MMSRLLDAFVRALGHAFLPRVIGMTLLPLLAMTALAFALGWFWWGAAVAWMEAALGGWSLLAWLDGWLGLDHPGGLGALLAPLAVLALATPVVVLVTLTVVSLLLTPALTRLVAERRFAQLARGGGASLAASIGWSAGALALAVLALLVSLPLWLIPPFVLLLPPLIWGWLTYRVMSFDALADYASAEERRTLIRQQRWPLLAMGVLCGYMGAAPGLVWASGVLFAALFVVLVPLAIWIYTFVFVFSSLWFAHYCLDALVRLRQQRQAEHLPPAAAAAALPPAPATATVSDVAWRDPDARR